MGILTTLTSSQCILQWYLSSQFIFSNFLSHFIWWLAELLLHSHLARFLFVIFLWCTFCYYDTILLSHEFRSDVHSVWTDFSRILLVNSQFVMSIIHKWVYCTLLMEVRGLRHTISVKWSRFNTLCELRSLTEFFHLFQVLGPLWNRLREESLILIILNIFVSRLHVNHPILHVDRK